MKHRPALHRFIRVALATAALLGIAALAVVPLHRTHAEEKTRIVFGTNWYPQAEHGGVFQAKAAGIWAAKGLDVELRIGGPNVNTAQLLATGALDFAMVSNSFIALNFVKEDIPMVAVAAMYQKDPQALMAHADAGIGSLADIKGKPVFISTDARDSFWPFLVSKFGFSDDQARPYTFSIAPFLQDRGAIQQCYISNEPYAAQKEGARVKTFLLADYGYKSYSQVVMTSRKMVEEHPEIVQKVVDGIIEGWYQYLYGDGMSANNLIMEMNPEWTPDRTENSMKILKEAGLIDSTDALTLGIGAMTEARWKQFFADAAGAGMYPAGLDHSRAYTLQFVNKGHGLDLKKKLTGL